MQDLPYPRPGTHLVSGQHPQVQGGQALSRQARKPLLGHSVQCQLESALVFCMGLATDRPHEGPGHKLGVQFPTQPVQPKIKANVDRRAVRHREVVIACQAGQVSAAGIALLRVAHHHHMRQGHRHTHRLGRAGMDLVVKGKPLGVLPRL